MKKRKQKTMVLFLERDDPKRELEFEVDFALSLTMKQRYAIMEEIYREAVEQMKRHGHTDTPGLTARS